MARTQVTGQAEIKGYSNNASIPHCDREASLSCWKEWQPIPSAKSHLLHLCANWKDQSGSSYRVALAQDGDALDVTKVTAWCVEVAYPRKISLKISGKSACIVWGLGTKRQYSLCECDDVKLVWQREGSQQFRWERVSRPSERKEMGSVVDAELPGHQDTHARRVRLRSEFRQRRQDILARTAEQGGQETLSLTSLGISGNNEDIDKKTTTSASRPANSEIIHGHETNDNCARHAATPKSEEADLTSATRASESCETSKSNTFLKMGVVYWGDFHLQGTDRVKGWDMTGQGPGGFPIIDPQTDAIRHSWKGRMDNAHATLRMCATDRAGFKKYLQHFMMLSSRACMEFDLPSFHRHNKAQKKKVLTERAVIGAILESFDKRMPQSSGLIVSNGGPHEQNFVELLQRRSRSYKEQARKLGGQFVAIILEGSGEELRFASAGKLLQSIQKDAIKRLLIIVGGPAGITPQTREKLRTTVEEHTDFPLLGVALPGDTMHSYYALATVFVFHDQELLLPFIQSRVETLRPANEDETSTSADTENRSTQLEW